MPATVTGCEEKKKPTLWKTSVMTKPVLQDTSWPCLQGDVIPSWV